MKNVSKLFAGLLVLSLAATVKAGSLESAVDSIGSSISEASKAVAAQFATAKKAPKVTENKQNCRWEQGGEVCSTGASYQCKAGYWKTVYESEIGNRDVFVCTDGNGFGGDGKTTGTGPGEQAP